MRLAFAPIGVAVLVVLLAVSLPWMFFILGMWAIGDDDAADRIEKRMPLKRYFDWLDDRR